MFMYFLLPYWVLTICWSRAQTNIRAEFSSGKLPTIRACWRISRFSRLNHIVGADNGPGFRRENRSRSTFLQCHPPPSWQPPSASWTPPYATALTFSRAAFLLACLGVDCLEYFRYLLYLGARYNWRTHCGISRHHPTGIWYRGTLLPQLSAHQGTCLQR